MPNSFTETDEMSKGFVGSGGIMFGPKAVEIHLVVESMVCNHTDIGVPAMKYGERCAKVKGFNGKTVENECNILTTKHPCVGRCVGSIHDTIYTLFEVLVPTFGKVLMLVVGFTLPILNTKVS